MRERGAKKTLEGLGSYKTRPESYGLLERFTFTTTNIPSKCKRLPKQETAKKEELRKPERENEKDNHSILYTA